MQAVWIGRMIAESDDVIENNNEKFFPVSDVDLTYLKISSHKTFSEEKGEISWFHLTDGDFLNENGAWTYSNLPENYKELENRIVFNEKVVIQS